MMIFIGLLGRVMRRRCLLGLEGRRRGQRRRRLLGMVTTMERRYVFYLYFSPILFPFVTSIVNQADIQTKKTSSGNAFDDILYNSDSDAESENDVPEQSGPNATRGKGPQPTQSSQFQSRKGAPVQKEKKEKKLKDTTSYIRNEGDEPMDLLSRGIAGGVASELILPSLPSLCLPFGFFHSSIVLEEMGNDEDNVGSKRLS